MSAKEKCTRCADIAPLLVFYACAEVTVDERSRIEEHLAACVDCSLQLEEEKNFLATLESAPQAADSMDSTGSLLAQARSELAESLDDMSAPAVAEEPRPVLGWAHRWMALRPALSAACLIFFGVLLGTQLVQWLPRESGNNGSAVNVLAAPRLTDDELSHMVVAGISPSNSPYAVPGTVQVQLRAEQPVVLTGSVDDADVRRVLTYVVSNSQRFDSGIRLDSVDALKSRVRDSEVRQALLVAARNDQNPAVRIKALESLREVSSDPSVRETLLNVLQHDANPGVRVEAVNLLVVSLESLEQSDGNSSSIQAGTRNSDTARVMRALSELQHTDPNRYVRLRSGAALRQLGSQDDQ